VEREKDVKEAASESSPALLSAARVIGVKGGVQDQPSSLPAVGMSASAVVEAHGRGDDALPNARRGCDAHGSDGSALQPQPHFPLKK